MRKFAILSLFLGVSMLATIKNRLRQELADSEVDDDEIQYQKHIAKFGRDIKTKEEYGKRLGIFKQKNKEIKAFNN
jgi:hypothetical protein